MVGPTHLQSKGGLLPRLSEQCVFKGFASLNSTSREVPQSSVLGGVPRPPKQEDSTRVKNRGFDADTCAKPPSHCHPEVRVLLNASPFRSGLSAPGVTRPRACRGQSPVARVLGQARSRASHCLFGPIRDRFS